MPAAVPCGGGETSKGDAPAAQGGRMKLYHKNPRQITHQQYADLEAWLEELDDK